MPTKLSAKKKEPETLSEKIIKEFKNYTDVTGAILEDYMCGDEGMFTELAAADVNFVDEVTGLFAANEITEEKVVEYLTENQDDVSYSRILSSLNEGEITYWLSLQGYATIRVENLADKAKLEEFVTTQLYPNMNDADKYNL